MYSNRLKKKYRTRFRRGRLGARRVSSIHQRLTRSSPQRWLGMPEFELKNIVTEGRKEEGRESGSGMSIDLCVDLKLGQSPFLEASARCPRSSDCERSAILEG